MAQRLFVALAAAALTACAASPPPPVSAPGPVAAPAPVLKCGLLLDGVDRNVKPQDDLFRFVNGKWPATTDIPPDKSNYGSFSILDDLAKEEVRQLIVATSQQPNRAPGSDAQKV